MPGTKGHSGGARQGSGPIRRRFTLTAPAAIYLRTLTQSRHKRKDVSDEEVGQTLEMILQEHAAALVIPAPDQE
jgi:hypothetical protein